MATIIVNTTLDENDGSIVDGDISLRDAIAFADSEKGRETITFASGLGEAFECGGTIRLDAALGELVFRSDVTIDGDLDDDGAPDVTITGDTLGDDLMTTDPLGNNITDAISNTNTGDNVRVLRTTEGVGTLELDGLVITGGFTRGQLFPYGNGGGGVYVATGLMLANSSVSGNHADSGGGGIRNTGTLTVLNTQVSVNDARWAGGIENSGILTLTNTTVRGNSGSGGEGGGGGGIGNTGTLTLTDTTVSDNRADAEGGGIANADTATLTNTTVSGNSSSIGGGGIFNSVQGNLTLTNTTMSGNYGAAGAGGILNIGNLVLNNATVSGNYSVNEQSTGGGIENRGAAALTNTIVLGNSTPTNPEIEGTVTETGPNIIGGNPIQVFAAVEPDTGGGLLADNGGVVQTIALKNEPSNPALDAGRDDRLDESVAGIDLNGDGDTEDVINTDARGDGFTRFADVPGVANNGANIVDLGAYELQGDETSEAACVEVSFVSESAGYRSTYGWYDTGTLEAGIFVANVDTATNPGLETFVAALPLSPKDLETLGFFLIPDGYNQNADPGEPFASGDGTDLNLEVFETNGVWQVRDTDTCYVFLGLGAPAYFTEADKNPAGNDHVMEEGDLLADGAVTHNWEDLPGLGDTDFDDVVFEVETNYTVEVSFVSEDAWHQSTYGWYHTETGAAEILVANVDTATNPDLADFTGTLSLTADEIQHLGFFLIPDGYNENSDPGEPLAEGDSTELDLDLEVFETNGVWQVRDADSGYVFVGASAPAYFTEADKNPAGNDHVMKEGDLLADGAVTHNWEDLPGLGDQDFNDVVFDVSLGCEAGDTGTPGDDVPLDDVNILDLGSDDFIL